MLLNNRTHASTPSLHVYRTRIRTTISCSNIDHTSAIGIPKGALGNKYDLRHACRMHVRTTLIRAPITWAATPQPTSQSATPVALRTPSDTMSLGPQKPKLLMNKRNLCHAKSFCPSLHNIARTQARHQVAPKFDVQCTFESVNTSGDSFRATRTHCEDAIHDEGTEVGVKIQDGFTPGRQNICAT